MAEILILDALLRPIDVVDVFKSLIWSERYSAKGDFELVVEATPANKRRFAKNVKLFYTLSKRLMFVLTTTEKTDADDQKLLTVKGFEITDILATRLALLYSGGGVVGTWLIAGKTPGDTMRYIFDQICVEGSVSEDDIIPFISAGGVYPPGNIVEPAGLIEWEQKPDSVLKALTDLSDIWDLGFRLYKDPELSKLYFEVYSGSDRTTQQNILSPVIFSPDLDNFQNTTEFEDISASFNTVRVMYTYEETVGEGEAAVTTEYTISYVVRDDSVEPPEGFDRRVKVLLVSSIPDDVVDIEAFLIQSALDELMKSRPIRAFDGEVSQHSNYVYERDYFLGDIVETRSATGATSFMRVEEYIFVEDEQGVRSYPTLTTKAYIQAGTWNSWKYDVDWSAMGSGEYWSNQ